MRDKAVPAASSHASSKPKPATRSAARMPRNAANGSGVGSPSPRSRRGSGLASSGTASHRSPVRAHTTVWARRLHGGATAGVGRRGAGTNPSPAWRSPSPPDARRPQRGRRASGPGDVSATGRTAPARARSSTRQARHACEVGARQVHEVDARVARVGESGRGRRLPTGQPRAQAQARPGRGRRGRAARAPSIARP